MTLDVAFDAEGVRFRSTDVSDPLRIPFDGDGVPSPSVATLEALLVEGVLEPEGGQFGSFRLPLDAIYDLDETPLTVLGIPRVARQITAELRTRGAARTPDFGAAVLLRDSAGGVIDRLARNGPWITLDGRPFLVPRAIAHLIRVSEAESGASVPDRLVYIGQVIAAARDADAELDHFLRNENVVLPRLGLDLTIDDDGGAILRPRMEDEAGPIDVPAFDQGKGEVRSAYTRREGSKRTRFVLPPEAREAAERIRGLPPLEGASVPKFLDNPEAFLPDDIDLSRYSLRVKGVIPKRYISQPYVRARKSGERDWFTVSPEIELTVSDHESPERKSSVTNPGVGAAETDEQPAAETQAPPSVSPEDYARLCEEVERTGENLVRHADGWMEIDPLVARQYLETWRALDRGPEGGFRVDISRHPYVLDVISNLELLEFQDGGPLTRLAVSRIPDYPLPLSFGTELRAHQSVGYRWLRLLHEHALGGLLADDMGLGKTIQVLALLAALDELGQLTPTLLVLPLTLIDNWVAEMRRFAPTLQHFYVHQGADRLRDPRRIAQAQVVLTTYQTLRRDQLILGQVDWRVVVCDEAQNAKNPTAQQTSAVKALKAQTRVAVTGTPVENGLSELWCIVDFVQPGKLGSQKEFRDEFERPLRDAEGNLEEGTDLAERLHGRLTPHYLRRTKDEVLELPKKMEVIASSPLGSEQKALYAQIVGDVRGGRAHPLDALNRLIELCSHPDIIQKRRPAAPELLAQSPKLQDTMEILDEVRRVGEKAVVFTRLRAMQLILQQCIADRFGLHATIVNGKTAGSNRLQIVDRFNQREGFQILILSPEAAGVGLNIVGANHVIHYTRLWNPAKENQATDRVHRMGQQRQVYVHYPIVRGEGFRTVEERLDEVLEEKRALATNVLWPRDGLDVQKDLTSLFDDESVVGSD